MTDIHSCSYFCNKPECIKAQRDELRERLAQPEQKADAHLLYSPKDVLICKESGERAKVINGNTGPMQLANNKISLEWSDEVYGEYTLEQIMDGFIRERLAQPEQEPVQYKCTVIDDNNLSGVPLEQWVKPTKREAWRWHDLSLHDIKSAIEAKLKEKNND